jgi:acetyl esterase/lipase
MRSTKSLVLAALAALFLAACGGGSSDTVAANPSGVHGQLIYNPPYRMASLTAAAFAASLSASGASGTALLALAGPPVCGIDFHYIQYYTVGGAGEATSASGALMVPTGLAAVCSGNRPIVLYAHGTAATRSFNIADPTNPNNEAASQLGLIAAMFAAHGYIVVAPNYAGYDSSPLPYHPFLVADQQSQEMIDALAAARSALGKIPAATTLDSGKLFVTGYSQGGHVAMATVRAMQMAGTPPTASAPMSGPYATGAFLDAIFYGDVNLGSTEFLPLGVSGAQNSYKNIYTSTSDIFESAYATGIDTLLPASVPFATLVSEGKLPQTYLFNSTPPSPAFASITPPTTPAAQAPLFALGFGPTNLVKNSYRASYLADAMAHPDGVVPTVTNGLPSASAMNPLRVATIKSDMRKIDNGAPWKPVSPMLLCGGNGDPTVFFSLNTQTMQSFFSTVLIGAQAALLTTLDIDSPPSGPTDPFAAAKVGFATAKAGVAAAAVAAGATDGGAKAVTLAYHGTLVAPFCTASARGFFSQF